MRLLLHLEESISSDLTRLAGTLAKKQSANLAIATDLGTAIRDHFLTHHVPRQTPGIEFWQQAAASITPSATPDLALVTIAKPGVRLRYKGGEVRPVNRRALALPTASVPISGGARIAPGRAGLLAFIAAAKGRDTIGYLVQGREVPVTRGPNKGKKRIAPIPRSQGGKLMYVLRTITRHKANPAILPEDTQLTALALASLKRHLDAEDKKSSTK